MLAILLFDLAWLNKASIPNFSFLGSLEVAQIYLPGWGGWTRLLVGGGLYSWTRGLVGEGLITQWGIEQITFLVPVDKLLGW